MRANILIETRDQIHYDSCLTAEEELELSRSAPNEKEINSAEGSVKPAQMKRQTIH